MISYQDRTEYEAWMTRLKELIAQCDQRQCLGAGELAKSLYLYGERLFTAWEKDQLPPELLPWIKSYKSARTLRVIQAYLRERDSHGLFKT